MVSRPLAEDPKTAPTAARTLSWSVILLDVGDDALGPFVE
jgi:hypothetical protein